MIIEKEICEDFGDVTLKIKKENGKLDGKITFQTHGSLCIDINKFDRTVSNAVNEAYKEHFMGERFGANVANKKEKTIVKRLMREFPDSIEKITTDGYWQNVQKEKEGEIVKKAIRKFGYYGGYRYEIKLLKGKIKIGHMLLTVPGENYNNKFMKIDHSLIFPEYQGQGFGKELYRFFCDVYNNDPLMKDRIISREFDSSIALYLAKWCIEQGLLPEESWDSRYITYTDKVPQEIR
jgi:hypothetical protein